MARIRSIKPEFPQSESMGRVSRDARLLFVLLWTICDDSGRTRAASRMLASLLFPYDDGAPTLIDSWLNELERESCIVRYTVDGSTYLEVCKWSKHQKIDKPSPSRLPTIRDDSRGFARVRELSSEDLGSRTVGSRNGTAAAAPPPSAQEAAADAASEDLFPATQAPRRPEPEQVTQACDKRNFADWRITVAKRIWVQESERLDWMALYAAEGWEQMTLGYNILAEKIKEPGKIFLSQFQEIRE